MTHADFQERLRQSSRAVFAYVEHLNQRGFAVECPPVHVAPRADQAAHYVDDGDLFVIARHRIEIKGLNTAFTSADDWPHPHVFVDRVEHVDAIEQAHIKVVMWALVNKALTHCAVIRTDSTRTHWYRTSTRNKNTGIVENYYACPKDLITFKPLLKAAGDGEQCSSAPNATR